MSSLVNKIDRRGVRLLLRLFPNAQRFFLALTFFGEPAFVIAASIGASVVLATYDSGFSVAFLGVPIVVIVSYFVKLVVNRARPASEYVEMLHLSSSSFPSGHATGAAALYGLTLYVSSVTFVGISLYVAVIISLFMLVFVGLSRVYLRVHFLSDVIGGWTLGALGVALAVVGTGGL